MIYDVSYLKREPNGTTNWIKIGKAFTDSEGRIDIKFDAMPINEFWIEKKLTLYPKK